MILFIIGELNIAGPYTLKHSPISASRCLVSDNSVLQLSYDLINTLMLQVFLCAYHSLSESMLHLLSRVYLAALGSGMNL